eukprot:5152477-Pyramimonas_sp.AAC.1
MLSSPLSVSTNGVIYVMMEDNCNPIFLFTSLLGAAGVRPRAGSILMFPHNIPHQVRPSPGVDCRPANG